MTLKSSFSRGIDQKASHKMHQEHTIRKEMEYELTEIKKPDEFEK